MAKYEDVQDSTTKLFDEVLGNYGLDVIIRHKILSVEKQKEVIMTKKTTPLVEFLNGVDVIFFIDENTFDRLEEENQLYLVEEAIASIGVGEKIKINKPDVDTYLSLLNKYSLNLYESLKLNISQVKDEINIENKK